jgi:hypothetical protein
MSGTCILISEKQDMKFMGNSHFGFEVVLRKTLGDEKYA